MRACRVLRLQSRVQKHVYIHDAGLEKAVTYSEHGPKSQKDILGWIPASYTDIPLNSPSHFRDNPAFIKALNDTVQQEYQHSQDVKDLALSLSKDQPSGWVHLSDTRSVPPLNRTSDPEDIIGSILVEHGEPIKAEPSMTYRVLSSAGICRPPNDIFARLKTRLSKS